MFRLFYRLPLLLVYLAAACLQGEASADAQDNAPALPATPALHSSALSVFGSPAREENWSDRALRVPDVSLPSLALLTSSTSLTSLASLRTHFLAQESLSESEEDQDEPEHLLWLGDLPHVVAVSAKPLQANKPAVLAQTVNSGRPALQYGSITINNYQQVNRNMAASLISLSGGVEIVYTDPVSKLETKLDADSAEYNERTGLLTAHKGARLERTEGSFVGDEITYNLKTQAGFATNAIAESDNFRMRGERIEALSDGSYVVYNGVFTTCIRGRPDYQIRARRLTVHPDQYVSARNVTFYAGPTALITLPSLHRSLESKSNLPLPIPGYSKNEGVFVNVNDTPILDPHRTLTFALHVNYVNLPTGFVVYEFDLKPTAPHARPPHTLFQFLSDPLRGYLEQLTPPTYREYAEDRYADEFAPRTTAGIVAQNNLFVYNRIRTDLRVSRFPEFSLRFINLLGHASDTEAANREQDADRDHNGVPLGPAGALVNPILQRVSSAPFLLAVSLNAGEIYEYPTNVTAGRFSLQTNASSQPFRIGKRISLRFAVSDWLNTYTQGNIYHLISPETELDYLPTRTTRFGIGYRYSYDQGTTPFVFDHLDVRQELRLLAQTGGPIAFGIETKFDLERGRNYDTDFAILRNLDCMQIGLAYRLRSQQFNIIFNLLPPVRNRAARRATPLQNIPGLKPSG